MNQLSEETANKRYEITERQGLQLAEMFKKSTLDANWFGHILVGTTARLEANNRKLIVLHHYKMIYSYYKFDFKYPLNRIKGIIFKKKTLKKLAGIIKKCNQIINYES